MSSTKNTNPVRFPEFGERLQKAVEARGLNQSTFAEALDLSQGHVSAWFLGKSRPSKMAMKAIELLLAISKKYLLEGTGKMYTQSEPRILVVERPEEYRDTNRTRLVREVKELAIHADDGVIDALLTNVRQFKRIPRKPE